MKTTIRRNVIRHSFGQIEKYETEQSITQRFASIVARYPQRVAVKGRTRVLTYEALDREANSIAHAILDQRALVKEQIGLLVEQERAIPAILGVLKAGKTYVPLDPSYPLDRLSYILRDCEIGTIVAENRYLSLAENLTNGACRIIRIDETEADCSAEDPDFSIGPDALAAIIYTSGSTGRPKGVMQNHRNVLHRVKAATTAFGIRPGDRMTLLSSLTYSASLLELFGGLLNGATVYPFNIAEEGITRLADWLSGEKLTVYHSVPTVFRQLVNSLPVAADLSSLRVIRLGGDAVTNHDVDLYKKYFPSSCALFNSLSCNEAGMIRLHRIDRNARISESNVPVGYEVEGKAVLILDEGGKEASSGETGEIVVRSEFLSPGYWKRPELTAAAFRPDPKRQGRWIYHTGDLGRLLPDGCLLYKGRKDFRVKIRGIGVEMAEVEAALQSLPHVREAIAVPAEDQCGEQQIIAYVVSEGGAGLAASGIRRLLAEKLPTHMVPAGFVFLNELPRTANGKVDRQALPRSNGHRPEIDADFVRPQEGLEQDLTKVCQRILGIERIGVRDNLFDLGMNSLTAIQLISHIEKAFGKHLPPATLFVSPTVAQLAKSLQPNECPQSWSSLLPIQPKGSKSPFFWIHGDSSDVLLPRYFGPDQPLYALEHQSQDGKPAVHTSVEAIAAHYLQAMRAVQTNGPYFLGGYSFGGIVALEVAQQIKKQGEEVSFLALLDPPGFTGGNPPDPTRSSFRDMAHRHLSNLVNLKPKEQLDYFISRGAGKVAETVDSRTSRTRTMLRRMIWKTYLAMGHRIPSSLRSAYILDIYSKARRKYAPQVYRGRVIFFRGTDLYRRYPTDWNRLLQGDLEMHWLAAEHMQLREESYVHLWAEHLKIALAEAQTGKLASLNSCLG